MRDIALLILASIGLAGGTTLDVMQVYQPLSLHGTDVDFEFEGEAIQARVMPRPMVLSGALPEGLVEAIGAAHQMPPVPNYNVSECNLLRLYGISISGEVTGETKVSVTLDLSKTRVPKEVDLPVRTIVKLTISALKKTLNANHHPENKPLKVKLSLIGLTRKNASLADLASEFMVGGR